MQPANSPQDPKYGPSIPLPDHTYGRSRNNSAQGSITTTMSPQPQGIRRGTSEDGPTPSTSASGSAESSSSSRRGPHPLSNPPQQPLHQTSLPPPRPPHYNPASPPQNPSSSFSSPPRNASGFSQYSQNNQPSTNYFGGGVTPPPHGSLGPTAGMGSSSGPFRGSMILYRRADSVPTSPLIGSATPPLLSNHYTGDTASISTAGLPLLPPPPIGSSANGGGPFASANANNRASMYSNSGDSIGSAFPNQFGFAGGSAFTNGGSANSRAGSVYGHGGGYGGERGLVAYEYDPELDDESDEGEDWLHDPEVPFPGEKRVRREMHKGLPAKGPNASSKLKSTKGAIPLANGKMGLSLGTGEKAFKMDNRKVSLRGMINITTLVAMICALLALFIVYPMVKAFQDEGFNTAITGNTRINSTGQAVEDGDDTFFPKDDVITTTVVTTARGRVFTTTFTTTPEPTFTDLNPQGVPTLRRRSDSWLD